MADGSCAALNDLSNRVSASMLVKIAKILNTSVGDLVGEGGWIGITDDVPPMLALDGALEVLRTYAGIQSAEDRRNIRKAFETICKPYLKTGTK